MKKIILILFLCLLSSSLFAQIKLVSSNPANGDVAVNQDSIVLEFNLPVNIDTEYPEDSGFYFYLEPEASTQLDSISVSGDNLKVTFYGQLADDTDYIAILEHVVGMNGEKLESPHVIQFTTADQAGEYSVTGTVSDSALEKLKTSSDSYNGVVVVLSSIPFDLNLDFSDEEFEEEEEEGGDITPLYAATVDTLTGEYVINGVREGTYYPVGLNIFQFQDEEMYNEFFFPEIYYYDLDDDFIPDSISVNETTTTGNVLSNINLLLLDFSPISFSEAVSLAQDVVAGMENDPVIMGGGTYYFYTDEEMMYLKNRIQKRAFTSTKRGISSLTFELPDRFTQPKRKAKTDGQDILSIFGTPSGYQLMWEMYAYDQVKDSVANILVTPFGSEIQEFFGIDEAELPEGITFDDIKPLPETYIDSDPAVAIFEAEGGENFRDMYSGMTNSSSGYWDMNIQLLHEFWSYEPNPSPSAPVFWKADYYGSKYDYESEEYSDDYLSIYIDATTGEVLHKSTSLSEAITFPQAIDMAKTFLEDFENDPVIVGGETEYRHEPPYYQYGPEKIRSKAKTGLFSSNVIETQSKYGYQGTPNGYQLEWSIYAYDAVRDSALGLYVTADSIEFMGYIGLDEAELPPGVEFSSIKPLPDSFISSETAISIMESEGGAQFREHFSTNNEYLYQAWDMWVTAMHQYWEYTPNPTPDAPIMWTGMYYGTSYDFETEEYTDDSLFVYLDIETGEVLHTTAVSKEDDTEIPSNIHLLQNYPNPFNPSTNIPFELNQATLVKLSIYNMLGQKVATLVNDAFPAGSHTLTWNAANFASGVYFYRLEAGNVVQTRKLLLLK